MARAELQKPTLKQLVFLYANREWADVIFHDELKDLQKRYPDTLTLRYLLSREDQASENLRPAGRMRARIDESLLNEYFPLSQDWRFLVVGTKPMKRAFHGMLQRTGHGTASSNRLLAKNNPISEALRALRSARL